MNLADLVEESTTATSTATVALSGVASNGRRTFAEGFTTGTTSIPVTVRDLLGNFENSMFTLTSALLLTRTSIVSSSNAGAAVTFPAGPKTVTCTMFAAHAQDFARVSEGLNLASLPAAAALSGSNIIALSQDGGATEVRTTLTALAAAIAAINGSGGATAPGAPTIGTATAGNGSASVAFTAPASNGGSAITGYTVTVSPGGATVNGTASPINVTGLTNGTAYTFTVKATNAIGTSVASAASNSVTPSSGVTAPGAPSIGTATGGNASASVAFTAPASNGGSAITGYTVTSSPGGFTGTGTASPINVTGLTNGTAYTFTVTATNAAGTGAASAASNSVTPANTTTVPGAPTIGTATGGNASASVAFTAPASDGGSAITGYTVTASPGGATGTGAASPISVTGLTNGTAYTFTVTATNAIGTGAASAASNSVTPATPSVITPNSGSSVPYTSIAASTRTTDYTTVLRFDPTKLAASRFWLINTNPTLAGTNAGWGNSSTTPPAVVTLAANTTGGAGGVNGLAPMDKPASAYGTQAHLMAPAGASGPWFFWVQPAGEAAQCMNAGAPLYITA